MLLKGSTGNFRDEKKSCHIRTLAEEAFAEHSNPCKDCTSTLRGPGARMLCTVYVFQTRVTWFGPLMSSQLGFSEIQCGGQPAQEFDDLSVLCGVNVALRNMSSGFFGVQACGYSGR